MRLCLLVLSLTVLSTPLHGQTTGSGYSGALTPSLAHAANAMHATIRRNIEDAARAMPPAAYAFRPTAETRTFAQLIGHVINANAFFCAQAEGSTSAATTNYEGLTDKDALLAALTRTLADCDRAYAATSDASFGQRVEMAASFGQPATATVRGAVLMFNVAHNNEHYGNIVVYMRLKGLTPPSTAQAAPRR
jgi:uncharacterized damage-inducible protein DinB